MEVYKFFWANQPGGKMKYIGSNTDLSEQWWLKQPKSPMGLVHCRCSLQTN